MRILTVGNMFPPHHLGGYELTWQSSVAHLRRAGHKVRVVTTNYMNSAVPPGGADRDVHRQLRWYWRDHRFPRIGPAARLRLERHNARVLGDHLEELGPDVVAWWAMGGMSLSLIDQVRRAGVPAVGVVGDQWLAYGPRVDAWTRAARRLGPIGPPVARAAGIPAPVDLASAAYWLFGSRFLRDGAAAALGTGLANSAVAHPGIDAGAFAPDGERDGAVRLLYVGRIDPRKGLATAIAALAELPATANLRIVGGGDADHARELESQARSLGLSDRVELTSPVGHDKLGDVYRAADALVFPVTWPEPWGLVPLEAMACGTPVIATGTGGSGEYLDDGKNSLLFGPGDPEGLARCVTRLAGDAALRRRLRAEGLATAARHTEDAYNGAIEQALRQTATRAVRRPVR